MSRFPIPARLSTSAAYSLAGHLLLALGLVWSFGSTRPGNLGQETALHATDIWVDMSGAPQERSAKTRSRPKPAPRLEQDSIPTGSTSAESGKTASRPSSSSGSPSLSQAPWVRAIETQIAARLQYPFSVRRRGIQGRAWLEFRLSTDGDVTGLQVIRTSGNAELDQLAIETVQKAVPFKKEEGALPPTQTLVRVPVEFRISRGP